MKLKVFFQAAKEDKTLVDRFRKHLIPMESLGVITAWSESDLQPGQDVKKEIKRQLDVADIILLLVSPDFIASNYYKDEFNEIIEQRNKGPIFLVLLRPCDWEAFFSKNLLTRLRILPANKIPITQSRDRDMALFQVVRDIRQTIEDIYSDVKMYISAIPASDKNSVKAIQKVISLCYRRAIFTPFNAEISTQAMFKSLKGCRVSLQKKITYISSKDGQALVAEIIGELDLIERLNNSVLLKKPSAEDYWNGLELIDYAKLRIIKAIKALANAIDTSLTLPTSFVARGFWEEGYFDQAPKGAIPPDQEQLLHTWALEKFDNQ